MSFISHLQYISWHGVLELTHNGHKTTYDPQPKCTNWNIFLNWNWWLRGVIYVSVLPQEKLHNCLCLQHLRRVPYCTETQQVETHSMVDPYGTDDNKDKSMVQMVFPIVLRMNRQWMPTGSPFSIKLVKNLVAGMYEHSYMSFNVFLLEFFHTLKCLSCIFIDGVNSRWKLETIPEQDKLVYTPT